jgi:single-stranded-DNA-specific exonuclease
VLEADAVLALGAVTLDLFDAVAGLGPFGTGSPEPIFALSNVSVTGLRAAGSGGHMRFTAEDSGARLDGIAWRVAGTPLGDALHSGRRLHLAGRLKADAWNGKRRLQFELIDAALA